MAILTVIYDACVLYPAPLRDLLMELATTGLFQAKWSEQIHDEWIKSVLADRPDLKAEQLQRTRALMDLHAGDCLVRDYEDLIPTINLPDKDDRHVVAAAIRGGADTIVTFNLADFPAAELIKYDIEAQHPDIFIAAQFELAETVVWQAAKRHRARLKSPPLTVENYLAALDRQRLIQTANLLRRFAAFI